jgi:predicted 3-demethylubiquinone-9 3-methyltransferase (glyoxalase superfamily)
VGTACRDIGRRIEHLRTPHGSLIHIRRRRASRWRYTSASLDESERIFRDLAAEGQVLMPLEKTFWAERFGMVVDRFGIPWLVNCEVAASTASPAGR